MQSGGQRDARQLQCRRVDVDAGIDFDPGLTLAFDRADQDVLGLRRGCRARRSDAPYSIACRRRLLGAIHVLPGLLDLARRNTALAGRPDPTVQLAVLGLETRPADQPFARIEPEAPFLRVGRRDLVDQRKIAALVGPSVGSEMKLKEGAAARQIQAVQQDVADRAAGRPPRC